MWAANNYSEEMSTGRELLEELRRDEELRRALAEELLLGSPKAQRAQKNHTASGVKRDGY
jgi:hypothetical protein